MNTTHIKADEDGKSLLVWSQIETPFIGGSSQMLLIPNAEFNRHHEGIWNSRVLAFVPQPGKYPDVGYNSGGKYPPFRTVTQDTETFSDGTPVASYEQFN